MTTIEAPKTTVKEGAVEVRVRHIDATEGPTLGSFPIENLQRVIDQMLRWGIYDEDGETTSNLRGDVTGQFRLDGTDIYFEIIVNPQEAE